MFPTPTLTAHTHTQTRLAPMTLTSGQRKFLSLWTGRDLKLIESWEVEVIIRKIEEAPALMAHFGGKMLLKRARLEAARRQTLPVTA